jgi:hypothetical protein
MYTYAIIPEDFNTDNVYFEPAKKCTNGSNSFQRIIIKYMYGSGIKGNLAIKTPKLVTHGIQENKQGETYSLPIIVNDDVTLEVLKIFWKSANNILRSLTLQNNSVVCCRYRRYEYFMAERRFIFQALPKINN